MYFPPGFEQKIAVEAAELIQQAYQQYDAFAKGRPWALNGDYYPDTAVIKATPAGLLSGEAPYGFVAQSRRNGKVFVVFRGLPTLDDWLADGNFTQAAHPWGNVDKTLTHLHQQYVFEMRTAAARQPNAAIVVTGHGFGGGLAVLAAADLVHTGAAIRPGLYVFAAPRVGDNAFAERFNRNFQNRAWRIVNSEDIATDLPPATALNGQVRRLPLPLPQKQPDYTHVGQQVSFTSNQGSADGNYSIDLYHAAVLQG